MSAKQSHKTKKTPAKQKSDPVEVDIFEPSPLENELLPVNPLLQSPIITVNDETEQRVQMITDIESLAQINKQQLAVKRQQIELEVDNKKLDTARKTVGAVEKIIDSVLSKETLDRVSKNINTPMDMKFMAEAAERLTGTLKNLMNRNSTDEFGTKKKQKINFMFKSSGTVQGAIQIDNSDDE
ncbi:hypothetical protein CLHUN_02340 [Ruminiclostridium hungatei]|uniref:Uncharacterized protein n=1 Tax=Ruminiclostridium hungatei TaxID=48256 RepID=A0A1V4SR99_RUMHU|nr:hypothetical protein [Ruminiclostridium hungatei]OPX46418.1 hypothetical protein CLHUN_02340 [Ruminiclostridium hungatei]